MGTSVPAPSSAEQGRIATAVVYCEANFGSIDGKTANGLVRHSEKYAIRAVIDSEKAGLDAGMVLGGEPNDIPICRDLAEAMEHAGGPRLRGDDRSRESSLLSLR